MTNQPNTCPKCGEPYELGKLTCDKCGALLFNPSASTVHVKMDPALLRLRRQRLGEANAGPMPEHTMTLQIRGMSERITFAEGKEVILGRADLSALTNTRVDLTPYGAHERGVSREHAVLRFKDNQFTVVDLNSVNGTSVNLTKLEPDKPHVLNDNDEIRLGTLSIVVRFEIPKETEPAPAASLAPDETMPITQKFNTQPFENKSGTPTSATPADTTLPRPAELSADATGPLAQGKAGEPKRPT